MPPVTQPIATTTSAMITLARATILGTSDSSLEKAFARGKQGRKQATHNGTMERGNSKIRLTVYARLAVAMRVWSCAVACCNPHV